MEAPSNTILYGYQVPWYADFLHNFPHFGLAPFQEVDSTFNWKDQRYLESLLVLSLAPCLWLAAWLIICAIYFCSFCCSCRKHVGKRQDTRALRWSVIILVLVISGSMALALYGNEECNNGVNKADHALMRINAEIAHLRRAKTSVIGSGIRELTLNLQSRLLPLVNQQPQPQRGSGQQLVQSAIGVSNEALRAYDGLASRYDDLAINQTLGDVSQYNYYRWIGSLLLCGWLFLLCCLLWIAVGCKSRWALLMCVILAVISLIMVWSTVGTYLALAVATSDLCVDPNATLKADLNESSAEAALLDYYLTCGDGESPIAEYFTSMHSKLGDVGKNLEVLKDTLKDATQVQAEAAVLRANLSSAQFDLMEFYRQLDCRTPSRSYAEAAYSLCHTGLSGAAYMVMAFTAAGILLIVVIFLAHTLASHIGTKQAYLQVEVQDTFVQPREQPRNEQPLYYRFSQVSTTEADVGAARGAGGSVAGSGDAGNHSNSGDARTALAGQQLRHTPPPAYQAGNFFSSYGTSQGTLDSRQGNPTDTLNADGNTFR